MPIIRRPLGASIAYTNKGKDIAETDSVVMDEFSKLPEAPPNGQNGLYLYQNHTSGSGTDNKHFSVRDTITSPGIIDVSSLIFDPSLIARKEVLDSINAYKSPINLSNSRTISEYPPVGVSTKFDFSSSLNSTYGLEYAASNKIKVRPVSYYTVPKRDFINTSIFDSGYNLTKGRESRPNFNPPLYPKADEVTTESLPSSYKLGAAAYPQPVVKIDTYNGKLSTMLWVPVGNIPGAKIWSTNMVNEIIIGGALTFTRGQMELADPVKNRSTSVVNNGGGLVDFRKKIRERIDKNPTAKTIANKIMPSILPNWTIAKQENRINMGDPGNPDGKDLSTYDGVKDSYAAAYNSYDKINASEAYGAGVDYDNNDFVHFKIGVYDYGAGGWNFIRFRAFLDSISDSYDATWNAQKYIGRGENFYTYGGFDRKISLSWTVVAQSKREMIPMYERLNLLASACAPNYNGNRSGYMKGNIADLQIGNYVQSYGLITKVSYEINENSTWDISIDADGIPGGKGTIGELPHMIKVNSFEFIPINNSIPQFKARFLYYGTGTQPGRPGKGAKNPDNTDPVGFPATKFTMSALIAPDEDLQFTPLPTATNNVVASTSNTSNANNKPDFTYQTLTGNKNTLSEINEPDVDVNVNLDALASSNNNVSDLPFDPRQLFQPVDIFTPQNPFANSITVLTIPTTVLDSSNPTDNAINYGSYLPAYLLNPDSFSEESEVDDPLELAYYKIQTSLQSEPFVDPTIYSPTGPYLPGQEPDVTTAFSFDTNIFSLLPPGKTLSDFYVK